MQRYFSSGEILYNENVKNLKEGELVSDYLSYNDITDNMKFTCFGTVNSKKTKIQFQLDKAGMEKVMLKHNMNILMQSDILQSKWEFYKIYWIE